MNIAEKSMEKTRFYNREDLKAKDVARLISIWEGEAGESFTDYCNFSREADKNFLLFLAEKYPILYDYHCKVAGNDWLDHCIQYVVDHCGEYLTQWVPAEEYRLSWQLEEMAILVGQLIEILKQFDPDREVVIHTLKGENVDVNGYFVQKDINDTNFYLTDLDVIPRD